jgi:hypothetical protein
VSDVLPVALVEEVCAAEVADVDWAPLVEESVWILADECVLVEGEDEAADGASV